jgi:hypothetical protein
MVRGELAMIEEKGPERDWREYIQPAGGDLAQGGELAGLAGGAPPDEPGDWSCSRGHCGWSSASPPLTGGVCQEAGEADPHPWLQTTAPSHYAFPSWSSAQT